MLTTQQLQELEKLQDRMKGVRKHLQDSSWIEASTEMSGIRDEALLIYNDELALGMAEYYYLLGNVLVCKIENTQDLFGQEVRQAEGELLQKEQEDSIDSEEEQIDKTLKQNDDKIDEQEEESKFKGEIKQSDQTKEVIDGEIQLAWENLEIAKVILQKEYDRIHEIQFTDQQQKEKITKHLARVHLRKAELEQWRDNFGVALEEHQIALQLRLQVENHEKSRDIAESYFLTGNVHMYNYGNGCELAAMKCYKKALQILENNLSDELSLPRKDVSNIDEHIITIVHLNSSFLDSDKITELKSIIKMLYEKIDDLKLALKESSSEEYKNMQQQYAQMKNQQQQQIFTQPQLPPGKEVISLGQFGNAAKKKLQEEQQSNTKENHQRNGSLSQEKEDDLERQPQKKVKED